MNAQVYLVLLLVLLVALCMFLKSKYSEQGESFGGNGYGILTDLLNRQTMVARSRPGDDLYNENPVVWTSNAGTVY